MLNTVTTFGMLLGLVLTAIGLRVLRTKHGWLFPGGVATTAIFAVYRFGGAGSIGGTITIVVATAIAIAVPRLWDRSFSVRNPPGK